MVEAGTGRTGRNTEHLGDLGRFEPGEVTQHENHALLWIQSTEAALKLIAVGHGQDLVRAGREIGRKHVKVGDETALTHRLVNTGADDEAMEPRVEPIRIAESGQVTPGDPQRFLNGILGSVDVAEDPLGDREEPVAARTDQVGIRLPVAASGRLHEIAIHGLRPSLAPSGGAVRTPMGQIERYAFNLARGHPSRLVT